MTIGLLDVPAWLLAPIDRLLGIFSLPPLMHVLAWGVFAGTLGMWMYRRWSPQQRIAVIRTELAEAQRVLAGYDGEFNGLLPLIKRQMGLALRQLRLSTGAALLAGVPTLLILPWLSNTYDVTYPPAGAMAKICVQSANLTDRPTWSGESTAAETAGCRNVVWPAQGNRQQLIDDDVLLLELPMVAPAGIVHKWFWLNALIGNPAGYLPDNAGAEAVHIDLPKIEMIDFGPRWLRGWEPAFFLAALLVSLWLRWKWKLH